MSAWPAALRDLLVVDEVGYHVERDLLQLVLLPECFQGRNCARGERHLFVLTKDTNKK